MFFYVPLKKSTVRLWSSRLPMANPLGIENRICCYYHKLFSFGCGVTLQILNLQKHWIKQLMYLLGVTALSGEVCAGEVKLGSCPRPPFHINDFYRYNVMHPSKFLPMPLSGALQKRFKSGPTLAKTGPDQHIINQTDYSITHVPITADGAILV